MRRCLVTSNPCGTDTWMAGAPCQCAECQAYLLERRADDASDLIPDPERYWAGLSRAVDLAPTLVEFDGNDPEPLL